MILYFLDKSIEKSIDYSPKSIGGHKLKISVNPIPHCKFYQKYLQELSQNKFPTISANNIHTCHVGSYVDSSSTKDVMGCDSNLPSCKLKVAMTLSTNENLRISKSYGLMAFM
jgi:hypothetical protein